MNTLQLVAVLLGTLAFLVVLKMDWNPDSLWFDASDSLYKAGATFAVVACSIWAVSLLDWDQDAQQAEPTPVSQAEAADTEPRISRTPPSHEHQGGLTQVRIDLGSCAEDPTAQPGDCPGESQATFEGWGNAHGPWNGMPFETPQGDLTLRDMLLRGDNLVVISGLATANFTLLAEVGDGACDDSFRVEVDGVVLYDYRATDEHGQSFGPHRVEIPADLIRDGTLTINFQNTSRDGCGLAGVFNIDLAAH